MSNDVPPTTPGSPEPDPFAELLKGLINEPAAPEPAPPAAPIDPTPPFPAPEPALPPTEAMPMPDLRPTTFPPTAPGGAAPSQELPPTVAYQPPQFPPPAATTPPATTPSTAYPPTPPTSSTVAYQPSDYEQPTEILGGFGGGLPPTASTTAWSLAAEDQPEPPGTRRKVLIGILIGVAALLVIAIAILLTVLAIGPKGAPMPGPSTSGSHTPSSSPTALDSTSASPTPADTPSSTPTPTVTPAITSFSANTTTASCPDASSTVQITLSWQVVGATETAVASAATAVDATKQPYQADLDPVMSGFPIPYACSNAAWVYTLTTLGEDNVARSASITVTRQLPAPPPPPTNAAITSFTAATATGTWASICTDPSAPSQADVTFTWSATDATSVAIGLSPTGGDALDAPYQSGLAASGSLTIPINCGSDSIVTLTVSGPSGTRASQPISFDAP